MKRIVALSVGLWAMSWAEAEDAVQQMLPLAVGNRWDYEHIFIDKTINTYLEQHVTISITHTEDIEGHTYYVFSDMLHHIPPVPYFFIAGKKVRWEGNLLLFRQQDRDVALYQFEDQEIYDYGIPETVSDTLVVVDTSLQSISWMPGSPRKADCILRALSVFNFFFIGHMLEFDGWYPDKAASFLKDFGMLNSQVINRDSQGDPIRENHLLVWSAVINGVKWDFWSNPMKVSAGSEEPPCLSTAIEKLSWGVLKQNVRTIEATCPKTK